ncbi:uncharacterized protein LOC143208163 [Lasioglossum baleicum]|uniref:uncharacterized protein LOC143208163 n=1 Tax=Lasioglossum baleicum TaxID=434251 RepID=UPI003FCDEF1D
MSNDVKHLVTRQRDTGRLISRILPNLKKMGKDNVSIELLDVKISKLNEYWMDFKAIHGHLLDQEDYDPELYDSIDEKYDRQLSALNAWIKSLRPAPTAACSTATSTASNHDDPDLESDAKLPKLQLPTFSGDIHQWESFRDQFLSSVHNKKRLSKVNKLTYLKSCLTGEAARMLDRTPITESNYDGAWQALVRRFGNPRVLSATHMRRLISCPSINKPSPSEYKRLIDEFIQTRKSFAALGKPIEEWDEWFAFLLTEKLDETTRLAWEATLAVPTAVPRFDALEDFLENRSHSLTSMRSAESSKPSSTSRHVLAVNAEEPTPKGQGGRRCPLCSGTHTLGTCNQFQKLSAAKRRDLVSSKELCFSCFASGHQLPHCTSIYRCRVCGQQHHTTLHDAYTGQGAAPSDSSSTAAIHAVQTPQGILLATAKVKLEAPNGRTLMVRALLDSGSESSFLSEWAAQTLRLRKRAVQVSLTGYQGINVGTARSEVQVSLRSPIEPEFQVMLEALVTTSLVAPTPSKHVAPKDWPHIRGLPLADPDFAEPAHVDVLLGADVCGLLLRERKVGPTGTPVAVHTPFGWMLIGPVGEEQSSTRRTRIHQVSCQEPLPDLRRFWEIEEVPASLPLSPEDLQCEKLFQCTTFRDASGRYVVRLPFRGEERPLTGRSRVVACGMLLNAEAKRARDHQLRQSYVEFIREYRRLGHMVSAGAPLQDRDPGSYIPHHAVWKESDGRKKIRVVFNASAASIAGHTLNDELLAGPKLQSDLWAIVTRWRLFRVAFSTDIVKMFRQIQIHPEDQDWLRIVWRDDSSQSVSDYRLTTVTYGTAPAPFLAHRVLQQLASDEEGRFPLGARALRRHSYVDDILAGADNLQQAWEVRRQLTAILESAGFPLDKWASSTPELRSTDSALKVFQDEEIHGALGLQWETRSDSLSVRGLQSATPPVGSTWTKRTILAEVARLFDPLGWLAPAVIKAKILMQDLWLAGVTWDEAVESSLSQRWIDFRGELGQLGEITIPRWTQYSPDNCEVELHGFCDASERAYAAAVYISVRRTSGTKTTLLLGKSRVSPIKTQSIPRLELCGAVLLARLLSSLIAALDLGGTPVHFWTDSTVALAWIRSHPSRWKPFVAHRVAELQTLLPGALWRHVGTADNPADLATRGISAVELRAATLWWNGPSWIQLPNSDWPTPATSTVQGSLPEERQVSVASVHTPESEAYAERFSTLPRLIRTTAYVRRFAANAKASNVRTTGALTTSELRESLLTAVRSDQQRSFQPELNALRQGNAVPLSSSLKTLAPFVDNDGVLRVGGRLQHSDLPESRRHPIILDRSSHLTTLVIRDAHLKTLHGGVNATVTWIHRAFWISRRLPRVKQILHECVTCARMRAVTGRQQMGSLPTARVQPSKPFLHTGVDYAGPIPLRTTKGRGHKSHKGYVVVFVCLATKAVHLDAVSDLTSSAFISAFHRFTARRGHCQKLYSDNGTTFTGADSIMRQMFNSASQFYSSVAEELANDGTEWTFIPPYSPHMGGLWEAAVKSMKSHLKRVIGDTTLTYEEMATLLSRIEACLNSRPLTPLSEDPHDFDPLTPGHFLVGEPIHSPPEAPPNDATCTLTSRWRLITNMHDHFWRRWSKEYVNTLQQRTKWQRRQENLRVGAIVLVKDDLSPPTRWPLGRVEDVIGQDGLVRVVILRSGTRTFRRAVTKVVVLPVHTDSDDTEAS